MQANFYIHDSAGNEPLFGSSKGHVIGSLMLNVQSFTVTLLQHSQPFHRHGL